MRARDRIQDLVVLCIFAVGDIHRGEAIQALLNGGGVCLRTAQESDPFMSLVKEILRDCLCRFKIVCADARDVETCEIAVDKDDGELSEMQFDKGFIVKLAVNGLNDDPLNLECNKVVDCLCFFLQRVD